MSGTSPALRVGGVVLAGGMSSRMGQSKALLPFGPEAMLARVVRIVSEVVSPVVVVSAVGQELPPLPDSIQVVHDRVPDRGPLEGIAVGLAALAARFDARCEAAFLTSCDVPLLSPAFIRCVMDSLGDRDAAVPFVEGRYHPLASVCRLRVLPTIESRLAAGLLRTHALFEQLRTRLLGTSDLTPADPELRSLLNLNEPADYERALVLAGLARDAPPSV